MSVRLLAAGFPAVAASSSRDFEEGFGGMKAQCVGALASSSSTGEGLRLPSRGSVAPSRTHCSKSATTVSGSRFFGGI